MLPMANTPPLPASPFDAFNVGRTLPDPLPADPFPIFQSWFDEAVAAAQQPNPSAFSLATIDADGRPSNRIVLCRGIDGGSGSIRFFTNYQGRKGRAIAANPRVAACFHWDKEDKQVRFEGLAARATPAESDAYFAGRPWENRIGAWASDQSEPLASRTDLRDRATQILERLGITPEMAARDGNALNIPRPPHWGGFRIWADRVELWIGIKGRFHDRAAWTRPLTLGGTQELPIPTAGPWRSSRLQP